MSLTKTIAKVIQKSDKSYFFENYTKQAEAVIRFLDSKGYTVVPKKPTEEMLQAGENAILPGKIKPLEHVEYIYTAMAAAGKKK